MFINLATIFVDDQDRARDFYTGKLGFEVHTDAGYDVAQRWLTVVSPERPDGPQLLLELADGPSLDFQRAIRQGGKPAITLTTHDIQRDYEALVAKGVEFSMPPTKMEYGGTDAVFDDTCGNRIGLHQD